MNETDATGTAPVVQLTALSARTVRCGMIAPGNLALAAKNAGHDAIAIADRGVVAGLPAAATAALKEKIPCVLGVWLDIGDLTQVQRAGPPEGAPADTLVWAKNTDGMRRIITLSSLAMGSKRQGQVKASDIKASESEGCGVLVTCTEAAATLEGRAEAIGIVRGRPQRDDARGRTESEWALRAEGERLGIGCAALSPWITDDEDKRAAAAVLAANARSPASTLEARLPRLNERIGIMTRAALIEHTADTPELSINAGLIATSARVLPSAMKGQLVRSGNTVDGDATELESAARRGLEEKLGTIDTTQHPMYIERLAQELAVINENGFAGLFLTTEALVRWTRERGDLAGPGRGSAASSIVSWALGITAHDPIAHDLLFERFLAPGRSVAPDFDLDFEPGTQAEAQHKLVTMWGGHRSAAVSTWMTLSPADDGVARAAITMSLRARGAPEPAIRKAMKTFDADSDESASGLSPSDRRRLDEAVHDAAALAEACSARGRHPAAIALMPHAIEGAFATVADASHDLPALQIDHDEAEALGAAKIDCLALETLAMLRKAREDAGIDDDPWDDTVQPHDERAYARIGAGQTLGIFQLEAPGATRMAEDMGLDRFDDLRLLVALNRPGTKEHAGPAAARRRGEEPIEVAHPALGPLLEDTYGLIVYQEQSLRVAQTIAGFTPAQADQLRRAISKKKTAEMAMLKPAFAEGIKRTHPGTPEAVAREVWETLESQAYYAFNRAHSTCYAAIARACARIREAHPGAYACALAQTTISGRRKREAMEKRLTRIAGVAACAGIVFEAPSPWRPRARCTLREDGVTIDTGATLIDGVGEAVARRWGESAACEAEPGDLEAARAWMAQVGLNDKAIESAIDMLSPYGYWPMKAEGVLPRASEHAVLAARGGLGKLATLKPDHADAISPGEITRVLARMARTRGGAMLEDIEARVMTFADRHLKLPDEPMAAIATIRAGATPVLIGWVSVDEACAAWPGTMQIDGEADATAHLIMQRVLDAFSPGTDRVGGNAAPDDAARRRISANAECERALNAALADRPVSLKVTRYPSAH